MGAQGFLAGVNAIWIALGLLALMLVLHEAGFRFGRRLDTSEKRRENSGNRFLDSSLSLLLGLLLAFSFSLAAGRYEHRQDLVVAESNAIGTAWLRCDLLIDTAAQGECKRTLRDYLDTRIAVYEADNDPEQVRARFAASEAVQGKAWNLFVANARQNPTPIAGLGVQAMNEVIDRHGDRVAALRRHVPALVMALLLGLCLVWAAFTGYAQGTANVRHPLGWPAFALLIALVIYVTFDFDRQKAGVILLDATRSLYDLRVTMQ